MINVNCWSPLVDLYDNASVTLLYCHRRQQVRTSRDCSDSILTQGTTELWSFFRSAEQDDHRKIVPQWKTAIFLTLVRSA